MHLARLFMIQHLSVKHIPYMDAMGYEGSDYFLKPSEFLVNL